MRFVWLGALAALAVVMAVFTPYVFRTEPTAKAVAWSVMLIGTLAFIAVLIRPELLLRSWKRRAGGGASEN
ncbi:hypothetical protein [Streptomyces yaizuensis]|uniref:Uncharacterized protein n=1 Tax=Streptomyces yaizuensis TaxID=2989713 RepID=A0ABQ5PBA1_9ACTN|nr:hypothetical protein [Streptomyces sp. YSPA8]GLF99865.1 hypothetical protein SYYSPA8_36230 [Streptomyces sp. YSPA8]